MLFKTLIPFQTFKTVYPINKQKSVFEIQPKLTVSSVVCACVAWPIIVSRGFDKSRIMDFFILHRHVKKKTLT